MGRFEQIYEEQREAVRAFVCRRAPESLVEDVVSETFLVCWRKLDRVPDEPLPWLYAVARKTLANQRRRLAREKRAGAADSTSALGEPGSLGQAAVVLGCSAVASRVRYHRAKTRLARRLDATEAFRQDLKGATR